MAFPKGHDYSRETKFRPGEGGNVRGRPKALKTIVADTAKPLRRHGAVLVELCVKRALDGDSAALSACVFLLGAQALIERDAKQQIPPAQG